MLTDFNSPDNRTNVESFKLLFDVDQATFYDSLTPVQRLANSQLPFGS